MKQQKKDSAPPFSGRRKRLPWSDGDRLISAFFGSGATVSILILALIALFLFKEGAGFAGMYRDSLRSYRACGLEYVDILKTVRAEHTALNRFLAGIRTEWIDLMRERGMDPESTRSSQADAFFQNYYRLGEELRGTIRERMEAAIELRDRRDTNDSLREAVLLYERRIERANRSSHRLSDNDRTTMVAEFRRAARTATDEEAGPLGASAERLASGGEPLETDWMLYRQLLERERIEAAGMIEAVDGNAALARVTGSRTELAAILERLEVGIESHLAQARGLTGDTPEIAPRLERFRELNAMFIAGLPNTMQRLEDWDPDRPVPLAKALATFLTGRDWITASDQQDWYGLLPLLSGSLLISFIALLFAVPFGIGAAIYVNQFARAGERNLIKPYIEFVSAIPSVVIGFFGVTVLGESIRLLSRHPFLEWVPFFPLQERLNAFTAGCLLALMAVPTIFTLAEDALDSIPRQLKEASLAAGATNLQTTVRVLLPAAFSGIVSAVMLGFGRVIGETMVVLLCAGNRIKVPDFTDGIGVFFEPVHTMTGIIAQEMGEVVQGSLHYRALFMLGIVLFALSLAINFAAQWATRRLQKTGW